MVNEVKLVSLAQPHLDADESVLSSAFGAYETERMGQAAVRNGVLLATERRVVFFAKRLGGHEMESFPYENISSFESGKALMGGTITFFASNNRVHVKWINPVAAANSLLEVVRKKMNESAAPASSAPAVEASVIDKIRQLGGLRDAGIVTEDEFNQKKAELLAQL